MRTIQTHTYIHNYWFQIQLMQIKNSILFVFIFVCLKLFFMFKFITHFNFVLFMLLIFYLVKKGI